MQRSLKTVMGVFFTTFCAATFFSTTARAECYSYDDLGRLVSVVYDDANSAKRTYTMDEHGNRNIVEDATSGGGVCPQPSGSRTAGQGAAVGSGNYDVVIPPDDPPADAPPATNTPPAVNTPPCADDEGVSLQINSSLTVNPLEGDSDSACNVVAEDGDVLSLTSIMITSGAGLLGAVQSGNSVSITAGNFAGAASISYIVSDGNGGTDTGIISVLITDEQIICPDGQFSPVCN